MRTVRQLLVLAFLAQSILGAEAPGWSRGQQLLPLNFQDCVRRASQALTNEGYRVDYAAGAFAVGVKDVHTAVIMCNAGPESKQWINIVVASNGEGGGLERTKLQSQMESPGSATPPGNGGGPSHAGKLLTVRVNGNRARVEWSSAPVTEGAWVSIVPAGTPDGSHVGRWAYTSGKSAGTYENGPLDIGAYEARFYGDGGYTQILDRVRFNVGADAPSTGHIIGVRVEGRAAVLSWGNAPTGDPQAWVSVVPATMSDGTHANKWVYTNGKATGVYTTGELTPGDYQARFYADGGYEKIIDRINFHVD